MAKSYNTGGVVKPTHSTPGQDASDCSIESASEGTTAGQPNVKADTPPGSHAGRI